MNNLTFFNRCFDKGRLKSLILWSLSRSGEKKTIELVEDLKDIGFASATKAGLSLGIDDLKIPLDKIKIISSADFEIENSQNESKKGNLTGVEKFQKMIDTWHRTSEILKQNVIQNFQTTDPLNPVYMMAFSGARGNMSQVRQLVGMRGLMADPQGQILDFPIKSNFREGLTLTEYVISCYGARKGLVDTALRTANSGYLTRRLVDVSQHVIVRQLDCGTNRGVVLNQMKDGKKIIFSLRSRLIGRVLAENVGNIGKRNQDISPALAAQLVKLKKQITVRSPLTCNGKNSICQLCYGWSLAHGNLVSLGEAVGILAAQSIGEPGTQLTMRTFHTGGVFSGDIMDEIRAPFDGVVTFSEALQGLLIRTIHGKIAFLTKIEGNLILNSTEKKRSISFPIGAGTTLFIREKEKVVQEQLLAEFSTSSIEGYHSKYKLNSKNEGQIYFEDVSLLVKKGKGNDISRTALQFGSMWILSGRIYQPKIPSQIYSVIGDIINKDSILNESALITRYTASIENIEKQLRISINFFHPPFQEINYRKLGYILNDLKKRSRFFLPTSIQEKSQKIDNFYFSWLVETEVKKGEKTKLDSKSEKARESLQNLSSFPFLQNPYSGSCYLTTIQNWNKKEESSPFLNRKSGWIYIGKKPSDRTGVEIKTQFDFGKESVDGIIFDQQPVSLEKIPISKLRIHPLRLKRLKKSFHLFTSISEKITDGGSLDQKDEVHNWSIFTRPLKIYLFRRIDTKKFDSQKLQFYKITNNFSKKIQINNNNQQFITRVAALHAEIDLIIQQKTEGKIINVFFQTSRKLPLNFIGLTDLFHFQLSGKVELNPWMVDQNSLKYKKTETKIVFGDVLAQQPLAITSFRSYYSGEITTKQTKDEKVIILTSQDQVSLKAQESNHFVKVGQLVRYGDQISRNRATGESGQILEIHKEKILIRKAEPILFSLGGIFHVNHSDFVEKNSPLMTLFYQRLKTGDIVQGIPKIEELFEARQTKEGELLPENVHILLKQYFESYKLKYSPQQAARKSINKIQRVLVDGVQRVYQSQGVTIADKHIEIIVHQMTSKVKIVDGGRTGLLRGELIDLQWIELVNLGIEAQNNLIKSDLKSQKAEYEPIILGITKASLETESFISAASFQETTRILSRAAVERKTDFLRGLKENVILGHLIPAGTGFSLSFDPVIRISGVLMKLSWLNYNDIAKIQEKRESEGFARFAKYAKRAR